MDSLQRDIRCLHDENGSIMYPHYARIVQVSRHPKCYPLSELSGLQEKGIPTLVYQGFVYTAEGNEQYPFVGLKKVLPTKPHKPYCGVHPDVRYEFAPYCFSRLSCAQSFTNIAKNYTPHVLRLIEHV